MIPRFDPIYNGIQRPVMILAWASFDSTMLRSSDQVRQMCHGVCTSWGPGSVRTGEGV
jgi:hypothetical protein